MIYLSHKPLERSVTTFPLLPHQRRLQKALPSIAFPFYIYWGMGSGKTIAGCIFMQLLSEGERALVLCDKSVVGQWEKEIRRQFSRNSSAFSESISAQVEHFETLDLDDGPRCCDYTLIVVDEAHRFRKMCSNESSRMSQWVEAILSAPRVVYMSGTPIVHDDDEVASFCKLMRVSSLTEIAGRVSFYDPRVDTKQKRHYAETVDIVIPCPMSWAQTFLYCQSRRQRFSLHLDGEVTPRVRISATRNTYNTRLRSICNHPFHDPQLSTKVCSIVERLSAAEELGWRQVVYSSRIDTGIGVLLQVWTERKGREVKLSSRRAERRAEGVYRIDGSMSKEDRDKQIFAFNRERSSAILFITDAAAQGIDLKRVKAIHIMEPTENLQEERQVINRAVRFKAHFQPKRKKHAVTDGQGEVAKQCEERVHVYRYISTFPTNASVAPPWKQVIYESGLFSRDEMKGITRKVQYALLRLIKNDENGCTIDERILQTREEREERVQRVLAVIRAYAIESA